MFGNFVDFDGPIFSMALLFWLFREPWQEIASYFRHKWPFRLIVLQFEAAGCILPYAQIGKGHRFWSDRSEVQRLNKGSKRKNKLLT